MLVNTVLPSLAFLTSSALALPNLRNHKRIAILPSDSPYRVSPPTSMQTANVTLSLGTTFDNATAVLPPQDNATTFSNSSIFPLTENGTLPLTISNGTVLFNGTQINGTFYNETVSSLNGSILSNGSLNLANSSSESIESILSSLFPTPTIVAPLAPLVSVSVSVSATTDYQTDYETTTKTVDHWETVRATETAWVDNYVTLYATEYVTQSEWATTTATEVRLTTISKVQTVSAKPTHRAGLEEMLSVLNDAASAAAAMPTVTVTLVPDQSDGQWTYVVASPSSPIPAPAATSPVWNESPKPSVVVPSSVLPVSYTPFSVPSSSPIPATYSPIYGPPAPAPSRAATVVSSGLGDGQDTVQPTLPAEVIASLAPAVTPTFEYSLPGSTGTVAIGSPAGTPSPTIHAGTSVVSAAVASATAKGELVGPIQSPNGSDEPGDMESEVPVPSNSTVLAPSPSDPNNSTVLPDGPSNSSTVVGVIESPDGSDELEPPFSNSTIIIGANSTLYGNASLSSSNSTDLPPLFNASSIISPNMTLPLPSIVLPSPLTPTSSISISAPSSIIAPSSQASSSMAASRSASASLWSSAYFSAASASAFAPEASGTESAITQTIQMGSASVVIVIPSPTLAVVSSSFVPASSSSAPAVATSSAAPSGMARKRRST